MEREKLLVILGPTATGKTARAVSAARQFNGEIISADSRQIYRGMDLGTGKDLDEYGDVPYHLIDIADAGDKYNLYQYLKAYEKAYAKIVENGHLPVLCGGTGLYIESVLNGIKLPDVPENTALRNQLAGCSLDQLTQMLKSKKTLHNTTDVDTAKRAIRALEIAVYYEEHPDEAKNTEPKKIENAVIVGIDVPRDIRRTRISLRLDKRLESGMVAEVEHLIANGVKPDDLIYYGLEYKYLTLYVTQQISYQQMHDQLEIAIHQFAKRQMTWFRGMQRRGFKIHWLPYDIDDCQFNNQICKLLNEN